MWHQSKMDSNCRFISAERGMVLWNGHWLADHLLLWLYQGDPDEGNLQTSDKEHPVHESIKKEIDPERKVQVQYSIYLVA